MTSHFKDLRTLKELIRTYQVRFSIQSSDVVLCGRTAQVTFHLELSGHHDGKCGGAFCLGCNHVLRVLFEVADALRDFERKAVRRAGYVYQNRGLCGSAPERDREVVLGLRLTVQRPFARASSGWGWEFVEGVISALTGLGCRDGTSEAVPECQPCVDAHVELDPRRDVGIGSYRCGPSARSATDCGRTEHGHDPSASEPGVLYITRRSGNGVLTYAQLHPQQQGISRPAAPIRVAAAKSVG